MTAPQHDRPTPFEWTAHPARQRPRDAAGALVVIITVSAAAGLFGGSVWWSVLAFVVLLLALNRFFFPSRFRIDDDGVTASYPIRRQTMPWTRVRRFVHDARGGYLSTRAQRSWTDAYRGLHLQFGEQRRRAVELINARVAAARQQRDPAGTPDQTHSKDATSASVAVEGGAP